MLDEGYSNLPDVIRDIPQNFGGGQNPGVGQNVPASSGSNLGSGSTLNLRGLGPDATLTLLNGHRLAYNGAVQGIDIAAIPFAALDRIEIVADGASALYGSDAVGGVANVLLKRDYDGVSATARYGGATQGGDQDQQYSLVGGRKWSSGGVLLAYDFERNTPVTSEQRSFVGDISPGLTLYPAIKHESVLAAGHQEMVPGLSLEFDALYNKRWSDYTYAFDSEGNYLENGAFNFSTSESFEVAPALRLTLPRLWEASLAAMYGQDRTHYGSLQYSTGSSVDPTVGCYCNRAQSIELDADGPLVSLPGGAIQVAVGVGYRSNGFHAFRTVGALQNIDATQDSHYLFTELSVPVVAAAESVPLVDHLALSAAIRDEDYPGIDRVATPKLGLIYSPTDGLDIKASWGRSFKVPTLYQQHADQDALNFPAASLGGSGYPAGSTALLLIGGNPQLKPERATTWNTSLVFQPRWLDGLRLEAGYFDIHYTDRIVQPLSYVSQALSSSFYSDLVNFSPTDAQKADALAGKIFANVAGGSYDAANVTAIVNDLYANVARQLIDGVDFSGKYRVDLGRYGQMEALGYASYLHSTQQLSPEQPELPLAGTIFNPAHVRSRVGVTWLRQAITVSSFANYTGGTQDIRSTPAARVGSMTTLDLTGRYAFNRTDALLSGVDLTLVVSNLFDTAPAHIRTTYAYDAPYDSTNYSPLGRVISLTVTKGW